jgi:hypothetical protein
MSSDATVRQKYKQTPIYDTMVDEHGIFSSYIDFFVFAACVGYSHNRCEMDNYEGDNEMLWMHFMDKDLYRATAASIAYQHHDDPDALIQPEVQLETLAKYAAGGAEILEQQFGEIAGDPTDAVFNFIQEYDEEEDNETRQTVLGEIMTSFDEEMLNIESSNA